MSQNIDAKKSQILKQIAAIDSEEDIGFIENLLKLLNNQPESFALGIQKRKKNIKQFLKRIALSQTNEQTSFPNAKSSIFQPTRPDITIEALKKEQNYKSIDRVEFDKLVAALNIEEPLEDLLMMLKK